MEEVQQPTTQPSEPTDRPADTDRHTTDKPPAPTEPSAPAEGNL